MKVTIEISGPHKSGKSTIAAMIKRALESHGITCHLGNVESQIIFENVDSFAEFDTKELEVKVYERCEG